MRRPDKAQSELKERGALRGNEDPPTFGSLGRAANLSFDVVEALGTRNLSGNPGRKCPPDKHRYDSAHLLHA
jgi:hypothetical protein